MQSVLQAIATYGAKKIADIAKLSARYVLDISKGAMQPSEKALTKLHAAVKSLGNASMSEQALRQKIRAMMEEKNISIRNLAVKLETDPSNLAKILSGHRNAREQLIRIHEYLLESSSI